ncbi:hypothetical protein [Phenylobacterium montanum]|uniref:Uncharacterized protein n=1 Tax=Phenylobacterium montanum TaxID=2823693 RepID=A0A975FVV7_9CAUL|nr:hypothetical protein [Caulobacter sp. S6]QUD86091.1 hypothetical protein KCG34_13365 [Caulobacter sp. S6]
MTRRILGGACAYFAVVFAAGFLLGTIRTLLVAPVFGELAAVLVEAPIMLILSWRACGWTLRAWDVEGRRAGLAMGAVAFVLLMAAELVLSVLVFGRSPAEHLSAYAAPAGALGLTAQILFGFFPLLRSGGGRRAFSSGPSAASSPPWSGFR